MKKLNYIFLASVLSIGFSSCKKYLDNVSTNPNSPVTASPSVMLSGVEVATFSNFTGGNARRCGIFTQHVTGTLNQAADVTKYVVLESDVTNEWQGFYSSALVNAKLLSDNYGAKNPYYNGISKILKALNLGLATDIWGDVPNKEALKGMEQNTTPAYDAQLDIMTNIQSTLSDAITDLQKPLSANSLIPSSDDFIYKGDVKKWIAAAWVIKARYANRLSKINPAQSATDAITYLNNAYTAGFTSSSSDLNAIFSTDGASLNQWGAFNSGRADYIKMGEFFINLLKTNNDPRLSFYADTLSTGGYAGADQTNPDPTVSSDMGNYVEFSLTLPLVTFVEAKFIEAEAKLRSGDAAGAALAQNTAVKQSMLAVTGTAKPAYELVHASETAGTISLTKIMTEKYVALFSQIETWSDWRRTNLPALTANPNGAISGIPRIYPTSQEERNYNPNAKVVSNLLQRVWWDL